MNTGTVVNLHPPPFCFANTDHSYVFVKPVTQQGWDPNELNAFLDTMLADYADLIDPKRIYLYGYSMGGYGSWRYGIEHGERIAAMMAIAGGLIRGNGPASQYDFSKFVGLPVWAFHNQDDPIVPLAAGQETIDAVKAAGGEARFTVHETGEHKIQLQKNLTPEVLECLFSHSR